MPKGNDREETLRKSKKIKAEAVKTAKEDKGASVRCARKQNTSADDGSLFVIPKTGKK